MKKYLLNDECPITGSQEKITYLDLGDMPLVNNLSNSAAESMKVQRYPLQVQVFPKSDLSMLTISIAPELLYENYTYKSGISYPYIEHCKNMFESIKGYTRLEKDSQLLDIGGNDGTLLHTFLNIQSDLDVLNIDASENITKLSSARGIPTINAYWNSNTARNLKKEFNVITTTNCFQHTLPIREFTEGVSLSLKRNGIWLLEFPYWKKSIETLQYDQVYHEHIYFYTIKPLQNLFEQFGMRIIDAQEFSIHGGTLRLIVAQKSSIEQGILKISENVQTLLQKENMAKEEYIKWGETIQNHILKSREYLLKLKKEGYKLAGFGAAAKGCIFLNSAGLDHSIIDYVVDDTDLKQGKYIPGTGIPVVSRETLKTDPVDYIIILAHNFADYIIRSLQAYKGKIIVMFPEIVIR